MPNFLLNSTRDFISTLALLALNCPECFFTFMADSIVMQLSMAGGGVSLIYSELLYSYSNLNSYDINVQISDFNTTNWKCLIVYHPILISPFIVFRPWFDANSNKNYNSWMQGITVSGTTKNLCILMLANGFISITNQATLMVFG